MSLFGDVLSPAQRHEIAIRKALELRREKWTPSPGEIYRGAGDLLLRHGKFWTGRKLPEEYQHLFQIDGGQGNCFRNAYCAARKSGLRYIEGVYTFGGGHFTPHAWLLDPDGELLELTARTDDATVAIGIEARTHMPMLPPERWAYWGIELHPDYIEAVSDAEGSYAGTMDRPIHDELFIEGDADDVAERRDHWPIYHYPYDPGRRTR